MNQQDKSNAVALALGIIAGIILSWVVVTLVNEHRFSDRCDKVGGVVVKYGTFGKNYCINPDALNKENN